MVLWLSLLCGSVANTLPWLPGFVCFPELCSQLRGSVARVEVWRGGQVITWLCGSECYLVTWLWLLCGFPVLLLSGFGVQADVALSFKLSYGS